MANEINLSGYTARVKELPNGGTSFGLSVGVKQSDDSYKNGFMDCYAKSGVVIPSEGLVEVKGFISFDFFTPKGGDKEVARPKIVVMEAKSI